MGAGARKSSYPFTNKYPFANFSTSQKKPAGPGYHGAGRLASLTEIRWFVSR
jgi:hypothetical protein